MLSRQARVFALVCALSGCASGGGGLVIDDDAGNLDASMGMPDMARSDATLSTSDAALDASALDAGSLDAAVGDAGSDAATSDGGSSAWRVYGHLAGKVVSIDPMRDGLVEVGVIAPADVRFAWDFTANVMRVIANPTTSPRLGTLDLCDATITSGAGVAVGSTALRTVKGFVQDSSTGTFYVTYDAMPAASEQSASMLGVIDVSSGQVSSLNVLSGLDSDIDALAYGDGVLYALDTTFDDAAIYSVVPAGAATLLTHVSPNLQRILWGPAQHAMFSWNVSTRQTVRVNLTSGSETDLGEVAPTSIYGDSAFSTFAFAPAPDCP